MAKQIKFTKAEINKERKTIDLYDEIIDDLQCLDGDLNTLEKRIKDEIKNSDMFQYHKWGDGTRFKLSELSIDYDYIGYDGERQVKVLAKKTIPESDKQVIQKLIARNVQRIRRVNNKVSQEKRERSLLKTLKEKYKDKV